MHRRRFEVGLDTRMVNHTGIGTYLRGLLSGGLCERGVGVGRFGSGIDADLRFEAPIYSAQEQLAYPWRLTKCRVWHAPHFNVPILSGPGTKLVTTVHDLIPWVWRRELGRPAQAAYTRLMLETAVRKSERIIAVSDFTKRDILDHLDFDPDRITVIHEAAHDDFFPMDTTEGEKWRQDLQERYELPGRFLLYVGLMKPHKNVEALLRGWAGMRRAGDTSAGLVCIGLGPQPGSPTAQALREASELPGFRHLDGIGWGELNAFYNCADALVHPSRYEGFGLTVLEAMAAGTPVLSSNAASLPEVGGDAPLYFDPTSAMELIEGLGALEDESERARLRARGIARAGQFSWARAAQETAAVYRDVLDSTGP